MNRLLSKFEIREPYGVRLEHDACVYLEIDFIEKIYNITPEEGNNFTFKNGSNMNQPYRLAQLKAIRRAIEFASLQLELDT